MNILERHWSFDMQVKQILIEQFKVFKKLLKILIKNYYKGK